MLKRKNKLVKKLAYGLKTITGRNNLGRITSFHRGGGVKKNYRILLKHYIFSGIIIQVIYDPNRNSKVGLVSTSTGRLFFSILPSRLNIGDLFGNLLTDRWVIGLAVELFYIPKGMIFSNLEVYPGAISRYAVSAGTSAVSFGFYSFFKNLSDYKFCLVKLPSGEFRVFFSKCRAFIGSISNGPFKFNKLKKAGTSRYLNRRPVVRGVAMNPVDHPHGGGEGKTSGGRHPVSPWGKLTKSGFKTRNKKKIKFAKYLIKKN